MGENLKLWLQVWGIVLGVAAVTGPLALLFMQYPEGTMLGCALLLFFGSLAACMYADWRHGR